MLQKKGKHVGNFLNIHSNYFFHVIHVSVLWQTSEMIEVNHSFNVESGIDDYFYVQTCTVKLISSDKKEYQSHINCINHNNFHTKNCKVNMRKYNKIIVCVTWPEMWKI